MYPNLHFEHKVLLKSRIQKQNYISDNFSKNTAISPTALKRLQVLSNIIYHSCQLQPLHTSTTSTFMPLGICINPIISLFDEKVHIRIQGLPAETKVTVKASVEHEWKRLPVTFVSCSHFITSLAGEVDLANDTSLGGSYTGRQSESSM